jgi:hypothetical protein
LLVLTAGTGAMDLDRTECVHALFLLNLCLQLFDGVATYHGVQTHWAEGNPLVAAVMANMGVGAALLLFKAKACGCLVILRRLAGRPFVGWALAAVAAVYVVFSFVPWFTRILMLL